MPPYLRLVPASACWKASKIMRCFSVRDADAGIGNLKGDHRCGAIQDRVALAPAA